MRKDDIAALQKRLDEIPEWPDEIQRANPMMDRLQMCQSVDTNLLFRAVRALRGSRAEAAHMWLTNRLMRYSNHSVLEISGYQLQGLVKALSEVSDACTL